jgi:uncharacterized protein YkuJ
MQSSQLVAIIKRLVAMQEDQSAEIQERRFEKSGDQKAAVSYDPQTQTFELEDSSTHQKFEFDNIDLVAMELYDLLAD